LSFWPQKTTDLYDPTSRQKKKSCCGRSSQHLSAEHSIVFRLDFSAMLVHQSHLLEHHQNDSLRQKREPNAAPVEVAVVTNQTKVGKQREVVVVVVVAVVVSIRVQQVEEFRGVPLR